MTFPDRLAASLHTIATDPVLLPIAAVLTLLIVLVLLSRPSR